MYKTDLSESCWSNILNFQVKTHNQRNVHAYRMQSKEATHVRENMYMTEHMYIHLSLCICLCIVNKLPCYDLVVTNGAINI